MGQKKFTLRLSKFNRNPIGTGPFKFKEWRTDELIKLEKNEEYWDGVPNYSEFIYRIIPDSLTQEMAFYTGTIDSYGAGVHQVNRLKKDKRFQVFSGLSFGYKLFNKFVILWFLESPSNKALNSLMDSSISPNQDFSPLNSMLKSLLKDS